MRKFKHWIHLNTEGKKLFGEIFPDGIIPVRSMGSTVGGIEGKPANVYLIFHEEIAPDQLDKLIKLLAEEFKAPEQDIRNQLYTIGIPIRDNLVSSAGTDGLGLIL